MLLLVLIAGLAGWCLRDYWLRLGEAPWPDRFWPWLLQGFAFPLVVWSVVNLGFGDRFPALVPQIADAQKAAQPWFELWVLWVFIGVFLICIHWLSLSYLWLLGRILARALFGPVPGVEDRRELAAHFLIFGAISALLGAALVHFSPYPIAAVGLAVLPLVHFTIDLAEKPPPVPSYSKAIARLKFGKYEDAEWEVISQLEKCENDFKGWMMLAELYARQKRQLDDAVRVVWDICQDPATQPYQISLACHQLADWQLEIAANPAGARAALEHLAKLLPGSHFARMAQQRLRQIPATAEEFDASRQPKRIRLPILREEFDPTPAPSSPSPPSQAPSPRSSREALAEADRLTDKLTADPNDFDTRQELATVFAEKLGRVDLAIEQLALLIELADPSDEQKARWTAQTAHWRFSENRDPAAYRAALRQLIHEYPQTSHAFAAQRRLNLMEMNFVPQSAG